MRPLYLAVVCAVAAGTVGCAPAGPKTVKVAGKVTFDGEPLTKGYIVLKPTAPGERAEGAEIKDGRYELQTMAGAKNVEITADRETGKLGRKGEKLFGNYVPAAYNTATRLTAEVTETGPNQFDFDLRSEP